MGFGYKTAWFAARTPDSEALANALGLKQLTPSPANAAIEAAYREPGKVFVTPAIDGWTLAMSWNFLDFADETPPRFASLLPQLSAELGAEVQFFATYRVVDAHAWGCAAEGRLIRAYCTVGDETRLDVGERTAAELQLGHCFFNHNAPEAAAEGYWARTDLSFVDEQHVTELAALWSLDPSALDNMPPGFLADLAVPPAAPQPPPPPAAPIQKRWWPLW
ncbi:hypothetical protein DBR42_15360 [Pelomonas sp. HMWF004]|nr:hypothetical protein DBR42_15360 [Pelomonas sp. HMWF004]